MSTINPTGFCPHCNQQVLLTRKDFDTCLAIVLLIFTFIGFFIYIAVYYSRKEEYCVHCGTKISLPQSQVQYQSTPTSDLPTESIDITPVSYCSLCGEKLEAQVKFCPNCGSKII
ncbi:MAG: zinc-ribbon domain-containing protein [Promethearchaeota archaeon]